MWGANIMDAVGGLSPHLNCCLFDKQPTVPILIFELVIFVTAFFVIRYSGLNLKTALRQFVLMMGGIFLFEFFTAPMWNNLKLGVWAYSYLDVSWVLTIMWATLLFGVVTFVDRYFVKEKEHKRFLISLGIIVVVSYLIEALVIALGIRSYAPEIIELVRGVTFLGVYIEALYYIPVFTALVIGFYKYWTFYLNATPIVPVKRQRLVRGFIIAAIGVMAFELMVDPLIENIGFPAWTYVYRDISLVLTGFWILVIWITTSVVDRFFIHWNLLKRYLMYLLVTAAITVPAESWLINSGFRVYGESTVANFIGIQAPMFGNVAIEVVFAMPIYMALVIAFVRYWEIMLDNRL